MLQHTTAELISLLHLKPVSANRFDGDSQDLGWKRLFGGQVVAQALSAASQTLPDSTDSSCRQAHSLHAYFLRPGTVHDPLEFTVTRLRDGRSFSARQVEVQQNGSTLLTLTASFKTADTGLWHQAVMPQVPDPQQLHSELSIRRKAIQQIPQHYRRALTAERPFECRVVEAQSLAAQQCPVLPPNQPLPRRHVWVRACQSVPQDAAVQQRLLAYISDRNFLDTALMGQGIGLLHPNLRIASLDHTLWFHQDFDLNQWLLYAIDSPHAGNATALVRGQFFDQHGQLVASSAQQGMIRLR